MRFFLLILILSSFIGCTKTKVTSDASQNVLSNTSYYLPDGMTVRIFWLDSGLGTFISQLAPSSGQLVLPKSLLTGDYGSRESDTIPYPLNLIAKVYFPGHPSGDFYFETPILGPQATITNVTTALSWYLRWGFGGESVQISKKNFDQMVVNIEVICTDCRKKTNSDVLSLIRSNADLSATIHSMVEKENPDLNLKDKTWISPAPTWAWSEPNLSIHGTGVKSSKETQSVSMSAWYVDPLHSTQKLGPSLWAHNYNSTTTNISSTELNYSFSYDESGTHIFSPYFESPVPNDNISFQLTVDNLNRNPLCDSPLVISMRANVLNSISLSSNCHDLDLDNTSLTYALSTGPYGLALSSVGIARWMPPSSNDGSAYTSSMSFTLTDSKMGVSSATAQINVSADHSPLFGSINSDYSFSEGSPTTFSVTADDIDGDPLTLSIVPIDGIPSGYPDGAGSLANIVRTGTNGHYSFAVTFTPSYLQTIGADGVARVKFILHYDNASGNYDSTIDFDVHAINFHIANVDDPPQWETQPADISGILEGVDIGGQLIGRALDPNPNPTNITYSLVSHGDDSCNWSGMTFTKDGSGYGYLYGTPPYFSPDSCTFTIRATDANNLSSESASFVISTVNVNQPITLLAGAPTVVTAQEGKSFSLPLEQMFDDPDLDTIPIDQREYLTYNCLIDTDGDGSYESTCASQNINFNTSSSNLLASWTPPAFSAGTYHLQLSITDVGGITATHQFDLVVEEYATAMTLTTLFGGVETANVTVNEAGSYSLILRATAASARAIDSYNFFVNTPTCNVSGGSGTCSASLVTPPGSLSSTGSTDFIFTLNPAYTDGDSPYPGTNKKYIVSFYAQKNDDPTVYMQYSMSITVNNTNRSPTAIEVTKGSFGCSGSIDNSDTDAFTICVDASQDKKSGNTWSKNYTVLFVPVDPDTTNDLYSFAFADTLAPGSIIDYNWTFKFPGCMTSGSGTVIRNYTLNLSDGRGGTVSRTITLKVLKASATSSCM